jgi:hypothetical protein
MDRFAGLASACKDTRDFGGEMIAACKAIPNENAAHNGIPLPRGNPRTRRRPPSLISTRRTGQPGARPIIDKSDARPEAEDGLRYVQIRKECMDSARGHERLSHVYRPSRSGEKIDDPPLHSPRVSIG